MGNGFFIVLLLMFVLLWFLLIRPQRAQQKRHKEMLGGIGGWPVRLPSRST